MTETEIKSQGPKPKTSKLAIASLLIPLTYFGGCFIWNIDVLFDPYLDSYDIITFLGGCSILWILGFVLFAIALTKIKNSSGLLRGRSFAIAGVVVSSLQLILFGIAFIMNSLAYIHTTPFSERKFKCASNLRTLGISMLIYANEYDDQYPTEDKWCDLLIMYCDTMPHHLVCPGDDAKVGESSYAMNKNVLGKKHTEVPQNVVLLFETNFGKNPSGRQELLQNRDWYKFFSAYDNSWGKEYRASEKVYKLRWNQYGGPEIATTKNHKGKGCNVFFNDASVRWVPTEQLGELKWKAD